MRAHNTQKRPLPPQNMQFTNPERKFQKQPTAPSNRGRRQMVGPSPRTEAIADSSRNQLPPRRTFQLLAAHKQNDEEQKSDTNVQGGDDWFVDLSRRAPTFYQSSVDTSNNPRTTSNVHQSMSSAESTLGSLRRSIILGKDYPPIINKYAHTRAAAVVDDTIRHPVPARIGGLFSSFVGTLHLDYKKSIHQQIKALRLLEKKKKKVTSKLQWTGLPSATADAGPPIRTAPVVEISLSTKGKRKRGGGPPLLVYEMLEEGIDVHVNAGRGGRRRRGGGGNKHKLMNSNNKYLYGLKPILSTNACGDGRIHAFENSNQLLERELNAPLGKDNSGGRAVLDIKSPSSPQQKPKFHFFDDNGSTAEALDNDDNNNSGNNSSSNATKVVTVLGIDPTGEHHVAVNQGKGSPVITQRSLQRRAVQTGVEEETKQMQLRERYWRYVQDFIPNKDIAPMSMQPLLNVRTTHLDPTLVPPGAYYQMGGFTGGAAVVGVDVASVSDGAAAIAPGVQVSMITSLPDLMPGSGEQLLMKATCRADGRFWSSVRSQLREWEKDQQHTTNVNHEDEGAVLKAESVVQDRTERTHLLIHAMKSSNSNNSSSVELSMEDISLLCTKGMQTSMNEMKLAKEMLDVIQEIETTKWNQNTIFEIPVDHEFMQKYIAAEQWRFQRRVHEVLDFIESSLLLASGSSTGGGTGGNTSGSTMGHHDYFSYPDTDNGNSCIDKARQIRSGLLSMMIHIAEEEVARMQQKSVSLFGEAATSGNNTPKYICHQGSIQILQHRVSTLVAALNYVLSSSSHYWNRILYDIHAIYRSSVGQSIVNYLLQDEEQRTRTSIVSIPSGLPTFGWGWTHTRTLPTISSELRECITQARYDISEKPDGSVLNNLLLVDIIELWDTVDKQNNTLVDLPSNDLEAQEMNWCPLDWSKFEKRQLLKMESTKFYLLNEWYPKAQQILYDAAEEGIFDNTPSEVLHHFLEACASLLSTQLWSIVMDSAQKYLAFFNRYKNVEADLRRDNKSTIEHARSVQRTGIYIHMIKKQDDICYAGEGNDRLGAMESNIVQLFNKMIHCLVAHSNSTPSSGTINQGETPTETKDGTVGRSVSPTSPSTNNSTIFFPRPSYFLIKTKRLPSTLIPVAKELISLHTVMEHTDLNAMRRALENIVDTNCKEARRMLNLYSSISLSLTSSKERKNVENMGKNGFGKNGSGPALEDFQNCLFKYLTLVQTIDSDYLDHIPCGCFMIKCIQLKNLLKKSAWNLCCLLLKHLAENTISKNIDIHKRFEVIRNQSDTVPTSSEDLASLEQYFERTLARGGEVEQLKTIGMGLITQTNFLMSNSNSTATGGCGFIMMESHLRPTGHTLDWLKRTDGLIIAGKGRLRLERDRFESALKRKREVFKTELEQMLTRISLYKKVTDISSVWDMKMSIEEVNDIIAESKSKMLLFNSEENTLGMSITKFSKMEAIKMALSPFAKLWGLAAVSSTSISDWSETQCVFELNSEKIEKKLKNIVRTCNRLCGALSEIAPETINVAESIMNNCRDFLKKVPLIAVLSNRGMRTRHWEAVDTIVGLQIRPDSTTTLERVMYLNKHLEQLQAISDVASKEWAVEKMLAEMDNCWNPIQFTFNPSFRDTGAAILKGDSIDIVQEILDEQLVKVQTLISLPQAQHFKEDVLRQESFLLTTQKMSELVIKVQSAWMYLYPVFGSDDIKKALAAESDAFATIDSEWRRITTRAQVHPQVTRVSSIENIVGRLENMDVSLDGIQLGLKRYLEEKRNGFPRFYFLSDEELLEILGKLMKLQ